MYDDEAPGTLNQKLKRRRVLGKKTSFQVNSPAEDYKALFDYQGYRDDELSFRKGDRIKVTNKNETLRLNWWKGRKLADGSRKEGFVPKMFLTKVRNASKQMRVLPRIIDHKQVELKEVIGKGGFATVRRGVWDGKEVAVKIISDMSIKEMLQNEAKIIWLLRHPNIISLMGVYVLEHDYCLVMEFIRGGSLFEHLKDNFLSIPCIVDWAFQTARGMDYLHNHAPIQSVIHRDLKSTNVLICEESANPGHKTMKITDFGLAKQSRQTLVISNAAGTFEWMAPEVFTDHRVYKESDVWSFGVVLWEMLTSQVPYKHFNQFQIVFGVGKNMLQLHIPHLCPKQFEDILRACWSRDAKQRPSFSDLLEWLERMKHSSILHEEDFSEMRMNWAQEIDREMVEKKTQSANVVEELAEENNNQEYLENIVRGIKRQYVDIQRMEMDLIEKQIYYAVKKMNVAKKKKPRRLFNFGARKDLTISRPTDFQHRYQTVVEQTDVSPTFHVQRLRFNEVKDKNSSQGDDEASPKNEPEQQGGGFLGGLREALNTLVFKGRKQKRKIVPNKRHSIFPPSVSTPIRPTNLSLSTSHLPSPTLEQNNTIFSSRLQSPENGSFRIEILQTPTKSKVFVTGNSPTSDYSHSPFTTHSVLSSHSSSSVYNVNSSVMGNSKYASIKSITSSNGYLNPPIARRYNQGQLSSRNSLQVLREAHNVTKLRKFFDKINTA